MFKDGTREEKPLWQVKDDIATKKKLANRAQQVAQGRETQDNNQKDGPHLNR